MAEPEPDLDTATVTAVAMGEESGRSASRERDSGNLASARVRLYLELRPGTWIIVLAERRGQTVFSHQLLAPVVHTDEVTTHERREDAQTAFTSYLICRLHSHRHQTLL